MIEQQRKALVMNIITIAVVGSLLAAGYFVFVKKDTITPTGSTATVETAAETIAIGFEIDRTVRDLGDLKKAVADSVAIFDMQAFKDLTNFSVEVSPEKIGRVNPFVPTEWKLRMQSLEESSKKGGTQNASATSAIPAGAPETGI